MKSTRLSSKIDWQVALATIVLASVFIFTLKGQASGARTLPDSERSVTVASRVTQGGDDIEGAYIIPTLPFSDTGTTIGYRDDYAGSCGENGGAPDVVYALPADFDAPLIAWLCPSTNFDSRLYIFENSVDNEIACNDDACGNQYSDHVSALMDVTIYSGNIYYFVIDGSAGASGNYSFEIFFPDPPTGSVAGTVMAQGGDPLEGALIRALIGNWPEGQDISDSAGYYHIEYLPPGIYDVEASKEGYITQSADSVEVLTGSPTMVEFELVPEGQSPCTYVPGDVNGSGGWNGLDVVYLVNYLKGFGAEPPYSCDCPPHGRLYVGADVNGSCSINGIDVIYLVNVLKYWPNPGPLFCPDCPPASGADLNKK
jgi:hypothetical protein